MGIFDIFKAKKDTAQTAKNRLVALIAVDRVAGGPDYLPELRRDLIALLAKHVPGFNPDAVNVELHKDGDQDVLDISVALPEARAGA
ncbi:MAG: cell division topological specificity factor MinE [Thermomonas sp.]|uniref:cell division topological specificity factor MinE n=1 Tax=Thermomonas sp. TaxID=1971895 RepID=UPI0039E2CC14